MTRAPLAVAAAVALAALTACSSPAEGYVEDAADAIELRLGRPRTNDPLAIAHAAASRGADVLAYGATGDHRATVDVRITREEEPSGWLSGSQATSCYRFDWAPGSVTRHWRPSRQRRDRVPHGGLVDMATVGADVGVSVHVPGQCLFGRISGGVAYVWRVPRVLAQPGELGCGAGHAGQGDGTRPPH